MADEWLSSAPKYRVTIIREMAVGFEPWDVRDLLSGHITLESARGWAATILFKNVQQSAEGAVRCVLRPSGHLLAGIAGHCWASATVAIGCHWLALRVPWKGIEEAKQPCFIQNKSDRFESHFVNVRMKSNAIVLQGMEGSTLGVWVVHGDGSGLTTL